MEKKISTHLVSEVLAVKKAVHKGRKNPERTLKRQKGATGGSIAGKKDKQGSIGLTDVGQTGIVPREGRAAGEGNVRGQWTPPYTLHSAFTTQPMPASASQPKGNFWSQESASPVLTAEQSRGALD